MTKHARRGILITAETADGKLRISIDDVATEDRGRTWTVADHVTEKELPPDSLDSMTLDEKELADFAYFVLARLSAFAARNEL